MSQAMSSIAESNGMQRPRLRSASLEFRNPGGSRNPLVTNSISYGG